MNKKKIILSYLLLTIGAVIAATAIKIVLSPNNILDGGIVGISIILSKLYSWKLGMLTILFNIPFLLLGFKELGARFLVKAAYAMTVFSITTEVLQGINPVTDDKLLATAFGGLFLGIGVGLVLKAGGCLDGTEILAILITKHSSMSVGQMVLVFNVVIYSVAGLLFGANSAMYSLLTYFITSKVMDFVEAGLNQAKAVMIITDDAEDMAQTIYNKIGRTVTIMEGSGLISGEKHILYCVVTRVEVAELKDIVHEQDVSAFVTVSDVCEIIGSHIKSNKVKIEV